MCETERMLLIKDSKLKMMYRAWVMEKAKRASPIAGETRFLNSFSVIYSSRQVLCRQKSSSRDPVHVEEVAAPARKVWITKWSRLDAESVLLCRGFGDRGDPILGLVIGSPQGVVRRPYRSLKDNGGPEDLDAITAALADTAADPDVTRGLYPGTEMIQPCL